MPDVLLDTGPIVALLNSDDQHHASCIETAGALRRPLVTTWPVVTEAAWLLRHSPDGVSGLLRMMEEGPIQLAPLDRRAVPWMRDFMEKYRDLPAQLADASLMYVADRHAISTIFTLDNRDFAVYRTSSGKPLTIVPEPAAS